MLPRVTKPAVCARGIAVCTVRARCVCADVCLGVYLQLYLTARSVVAKQKHSTDSKITSTGIFLQHSLKISGFTSQMKHTPFCHIKYESSEEIELVSVQGTDCFVQSSCSSCVFI